MFLQLILGRRVQEGPGDKAGLQQASRSLLRGMSGLLDQGERCLTQGPSRAPSRGRAEAALRRQQVSHDALGLCCSPAPPSKVGGNKGRILPSLQKLLRVLDSQLAFLQNLFRREPEALVSLEAQWTQLEVRARRLQQRLLGQEVASLQRVQVCRPSFGSFVCRCRPI